MKLNKFLIFFTPPTWEVCIAKSTGELPNNLPKKWHTLKAPAFSYWADPFLLKHDNKHYIFLEEYSYLTLKGHIKAIELSKDLSIINVLDCIKNEFHLSFPFVLKQDGRVYLIPESTESDSLSIYMAKEFPNTWIKCGEINGKFIDTIAMQNGRQINFITSIDENNNLPWHSNLTLISIEDINIIKEIQSNNISAKGRNGGLISINNEIYRVSQNNQIYYGEGIIIHKITSLHPRYSEVEIARFNGSDASGFGIHTLNNTDELVVIDRLKIRFAGVFYAWIGRLMKIIKNHRI